MSRKYGGYNYLRNEEWVSKDKLSDFKMMNAMTDAALAKYKPSVLENNTNVFELLDENIDLVNKNKKINTDRKKIQKILRDEESALVIKEIIELKGKLEEQSKNITSLLEKNIDIESYYQFLKNLDSKTKKFTFRNISTEGDLSKDLNALQNYGEKLMEFLPEIEGEEIEKKIKKEKEYIKYSISSAMSWKYVDLTKHSIGKLEDIMELVVELIGLEGRRNLGIKHIDKNDMIQNIYSPYIEEKDRDEFFDSLSFSGISVPTKHTPGTMVYPIIWYTKSGNKVDSSEDHYKNPTGIIKEIGKAIKEAQGNNPENAREFLVVILSNVLGQAIGQIASVAESFNDFQKRKYNNNHLQIYKNIQTSIYLLNKLVDNAIYNFFNMTNNDIAVYGIAPTTTDKNAKPKFGEAEAIIRVVGGSDMIKGIDKFNSRIYPLIGSSADMVAKLVNLVGYAPRLDINNKKIVLAMGGFIQKEFIGRMSIKIVHDYFERLLKNKNINVKYIDTILEKMRRGVHAKDLTNIRTRIENKYKEIGKISDDGAKDLRSKTAINSMTIEYKRLRNMELENLLSLDMIEHAIRNNPEKMEIIGDRVLKMRDEAFTKFGHYQLKAHAYKTIAFGLYEQMSSADSSKYPPEYLGKMQSEFAKMDHMVLDELSKRVETDKYDRLKNSLLTGLISRNVSAYNATLRPTITKTVTGRLPPTKTLNRITNYNRTLRTPTDWTEIESKSYWEKAKRKLDGLTVYIPFVDISILDLSHQHGLYDLINSAIEGKIRESKVFSAITDHIIPGTKLDRSLISRRLRAQGVIMVANAESQLRQPNEWRCMLKKDIRDMKLLGEKDLRRKIYTILSNKSDYQMETPYLWPKTSYTREKIEMYCKTTTGIDLYKCPLLTSRNRVANKIG